MNSGTEPMRTLVEFRVWADTRDSGSVCISGSTQELGCWRPESVVLMKKVLVPQDTYDIDIDTESLEEWTATVNLPYGKDIEYHYAVCAADVDYVGNEACKPDIAIIRAEAHRIPRTFKTNGAKMKRNGERFGRVSGHKCVYDGWLSPGTKEIRLVVNNLQKPAVTMADDSLGDLRMKLNGNEYYVIGETGKKRKLSGVGVPVTVQHTFSDSSTPHVDNELGTKVTDCEYNTYSVVIFKSKQCELNFSFYDSTTGEPVAVSHILPDTLTKSSGSLCIPIISKTDYSKSIGKITVEYLIITSVNLTEATNLNSSYWCRWTRTKANPSGIHIGHRGCGVSHGETQDDTGYEENTVESMQQAFIRGCDFVEFDVVLTKDLVPILFHDFQILIHPEDNSPTPFYISANIDDYTFEELKSSRTMPLSAANGKTPWTGNVKLDTLQEALDNVDQDLGFLIELKFPQKTFSGVTEASVEHAYSDKNRYVDLIIEHVTKSARDRRCMFTCFDVDICVMLRRKQNRFPVVFANQGNTSHYTQYKDFRCTDISLGIKVAKAEDLYGVSLNCENMLNGSSDEECIAQAHAANLITFVWGTELKHAENFRALEELGVDGLIYDDVKPRIRERELLKPGSSYITHHY